MLETALEAEMSEHLGYERHDPVGRDGGNSRNGTRSKTVLTEIGPVQIEVPRDRDASFDLVIVRKRQRRLDGIDEIVLSLTARGLMTGEIAAHFAEVYGAKVSKVTISRNTATPSATPAAATWSRWRVSCARSTPPHRAGRRSPVRRVRRHLGRGSTRRSWRCGGASGRSSCPSWTTEPVAISTASYLLRDRRDHVPGWRCR